MSHALPLLNSAAEQWLRVIARASLEGGFALLLAWFLSALLRVSGGLRCWFWRLAFLRLLASLVVWQPITIPLLRPGPAPLPEAATVSGITAGQPSVQFWADPEPQVVRPNLLPSRLTPPSLRGENIPPAVRPTLGGGLFLLWAFGLLACGLRTFGQWHRCVRLRQRCVDVCDPSLAGSFQDLCRALQLRRAPVLLLDEEHGPLLIGGRRPAIVLPAALVLSASAADLRMILAHELAHWRRRDFLWNWLFLPVQACFFFHPLVWWGQRQYRLTQEAACDEEALRITAAPAREYAALLVKVATQNRMTVWSSNTLGVMGSGIALERRLELLKQIGTHSKLQSCVIGIGLAVLALVGIAPWRVIAQPATGTAPPGPGLKAGSQPIEGEAGASRSSADSSAGSGDALSPAASPAGAPAAGSADRLPSPEAAGVSAAAGAGDGDEAGTAWEDMLLLQATRYLHLSNQQLADLLPMARSAARQLEGIQLEEEKTLETVRRVALRERDALAAGHNSSAQEQANAITMREATKRRRAETETNIVEGAESRLARLLTPAQAERAFLLEQGVTPQRESPEPALLDPMAGFVVGPQTDRFGHPVFSPPGLPAGAAGVNRANGDLSGELLSAQGRLNQLQEAMSQGMICLFSRVTTGIPVRATGGVAGANNVFTLVPPPPTGPGPDGPAQVQVLRVFGGAPIGPGGAGAPDSGAILSQPLDADAARQQMVQEMQSLSTQVSDLRHQLFNPDGSVDPAGYETLIRPLAHRLFLSPRFQTALEKRLHVKR